MMGGGSSRRRMLASSLVSAAGLFSAEATMAQQPQETVTTFRWLKNPINPKRSTFKLIDAETIYNVSFVAYLSRFLLSFDRQAQQWWRDRAKEIPKSASQEEIFLLRQAQFAKFAASVEVGLQEDDFVGKNGPLRLLQSLLNQFGTIPTTNNEPSSSSAAADNNSSSNTNSRTMRERKEARRQIALLFALLEESQPTKEITALLAAIDNGSIESVVLNSDANLRELSPDAAVEFPPPQTGSSQAVGKAVLINTGKLLRIDVVDGGEGYTKLPDIHLPNVSSGGKSATIEPIIKNGKLESVKVLSAGSGYTFNKIVEERIRAPESSEGGKPAIIQIVPEMELTKIEIETCGSGYAVEKPIKVSLVQSAGSSGDNEPRSVVVGQAVPKGTLGSFIAGRKPGENEIRNFERELDGEKPAKIVSGTSSGGSLPPSPFPEKASSSQQLLALLPQGFGLEYDTQQRRYILAVNKEYQTLYPTAVAFQETAPGTKGRPLVPDFGPRGRSPIERDQQIDLSTFLRFSLSGAICASGVHLALTPLDVVKTKVQIDSVNYPKILPAFQTVWKEEGPSTYFTGWLPTIAGHFVAGGVLYAMTEFIRRSIVEYVGPVQAVSFEALIILTAAAISSAMAACLFCPFDAVRIRSVSQPGYGSNAIATASRMVQEEGVASLIDAIPVFVARQVPYAAVKFTVFDLSTEYLYQVFPLAQEDLKLSLGVSLVGGIFAGIGAAIVSNPADVVITELKKAKSDSSPQEALQALLDRSGVSALFKGLSIRMVFYSLNAAFQFLVFDGVKFALGIGPDDLRLYLDVLGEAIETTSV
eukprot:CAMPEP_0194226776 /NCGR_PEP_ID=MMETSP0156-20130528/42513_1 /TAXON_ID=33649 /ORGANISM="Thalassionema nitzschioides, Strain L26-B" /LENGTH=814 /DNA_ID=CAMNT_0038959233 /DNA_START=445 /DNA_END=2889 /DNA_ORIENTATION=-